MLFPLLLSSLAVAMAAASVDLAAANATTKLSTDSGVPTTYTEFAYQEINEGVSPASSVMNGTFCQENCRDADIHGSVNTSTSNSNNDSTAVVGESTTTQNLNNVFDVAATTTDHQKINTINTPITKSEASSKYMTEVSNIASRKPSSQFDSSPQPADSTKYTTSHGDVNISKVETTGNTSSVKSTRFLFYEVFSSASNSYTELATIETVTSFAESNQDGTPYLVASETFEAKTDSYEGTPISEATTTDADSELESSTRWPSESISSEAHRNTLFETESTTFTMMALHSEGSTFTAAQSTIEPSKMLTTMTIMHETESPTYFVSTYTEDISETSSSLTTIGGDLTSPQVEFSSTFEATTSVQYAESTPVNLTMKVNYVTINSTTEFTNITQEMTTGGQTMVSEGNSTTILVSDENGKMVTGGLTSASVISFTERPSTESTKSMLSTFSKYVAATTRTTAMETPIDYGEISTLVSENSSATLLTSTIIPSRQTTTTMTSPGSITVPKSTTNPGVVTDSSSQSPLTGTQTTPASSFDWTNEREVSQNPSRVTSSSSIAVPKPTTNLPAVTVSVPQSSILATQTTTTIYNSTDNATKILYYISQVNLTTENVKEIGLIVQAATNNPESLTPSAVIFASSIVNSMAELVSSGNFTSELYPIPGNIGRIVGNLLNANDTVLANVQSQGKVSIQASLESSLSALAEAATKNGSSIDDSFLRLQVDNLAFQIVRDSSVCGLRISGTSSLSQANITSVFINETSASAASRGATIVKLSQLVANNTKTFLVYNNAKLFQTNGSLQADGNTRVLSAQLPMNANRRLPGLISMVFSGLSAPPNGTVRQCGYWDYSTGSWSSSGCNASFNGDNQVECVCEHLTNFAVLLAVNDIASNAALDIVSTVGLSLSVVSLAAVVLTFIFIRNMRRTVSQKVLFNLALSLLLLDTLFLLGVNRTSSTGGCIAVAVLLHYFLLTSFMWMLMESILQYLRFVKVLGTYIPRFMLKTAIPAWGIPAAVVAIICGVNLNLYYRGNHSYCVAQQEVVYYAVLLPIGLILIVNWLVFVIVLKHFCCRNRRFSYQSRHSESSLAQLHAQAGIAICTLLGLTWIFGFLTAIPNGTASEAFQWLFCICNTLQGLIIFVFHCLREPAARKGWRKICCRTVLSSKKSATSYSDDSMAMSRSASSTRSHMYSVSSDSDRSVHVSSFMPSHKGFYSLESTENKR